MPTQSEGTVPGYQEFELDITQALLEHLPDIFANLADAPLTADDVAGLPEKAQGVYMLLDDGTPTYIGKTDADHGFRARLQRHFLNLSARHNFDLTKVSFKAVRVMVFTMVNVEKTLIDHFLGARGMSWQFSGFGSNDPGHNLSAHQN